MKIGGWLAVAAAIGTVAGVGIKMMGAESSVADTVAMVPAQGALIDAPMAAPQPLALAPSTASTSQKPAEPVEQAAAATPAPAAILTPAPVTPPPPPTTAAEKISWKILAGFPYKVPEPTDASPPKDEDAFIPGQLPDAVKQMNGRRVSIEGYMVPMDVDIKTGRVTTMIITEAQPQCCFGDTQAFNEWIYVTLGSQNYAEFEVNRPVTVEGKLETGEKVEGGYLLNLYRITEGRVVN